MGPTDNSEQPGLPPEIARDIAKATAALRAEHKRDATRLQKAADRLTAFVGWPGFSGVLALVILFWMGGNLVAPHLGARAFDPPPFSWLQGGISTGALFVAVSILATQRREDQLAGHHLQLILELSVLNDRKLSKIIELIEEARRDSPIIHDRVDDVAEQLATPADAHAVLRAIKDVSNEEEL